MNTREGLKIGYARVSTEEQDYQGQVDALEKLGCTEIFAEKISGADKDGRPELKAMIRFARKGDTVHVTKLDRLARNAKDALHIADMLQEKGAGLIIHDLGGMDITSDVGRLIYTVLAAVAEMERKRIRERQRDGIEKAKADGKHLGRYEVLSDKQKVDIKKMVKQGIPKAQIARKYEVSRTTIYKTLSQ